MIAFGLAGVLIIAALVVGLIVGGWDHDRANKRLADELELKRIKLDVFTRELHHASVSLARKDDEIDLLNARLLEAQAQRVVFGDDDLPPGAA